MSDTAMLPARRAWRLLWILQGRTVDGLRLTQIAKGLQCSPTVALRLMEAAAAEGVAERIHDREEYWRLAPKLAQVAIAHSEEMDRIRRRLDEIDTRYSRTPD